MALGLKFYPKGYVPKHVISSTTVSAPQVDLRPHTDNIRSDGYLTLKKAARLLSFQPHMHNRGKAECLEAIYPTGKVETLSCAKFRFNWHLNYVYGDDAAPLLPAGTVLHSIMWHDNTAENHSIRIRMRRSRMGNERSTKWDRRGSATTTCPKKTSRWKPKRVKRNSRYSRVHGDGERSECRRQLVVGSARPFFCSPQGSVQLARPDAVPRSPYARGQDVSPTFDGWERNPDGTFTMYFGYFNRNSEEEIDVPIGPENTFDLGNGDQGQPTHFYPGRRWWVFKVVVPKDWPQGQAASVDTHYQGQNESVQGLAAAGMGSGQTADLQEFRPRFFPWGLRIRPQTRKTRLPSSRAVPLKPSLCPLRQH